MWCSCMEPSYRCCCDGSDLCLHQWAHGGTCSMFDSAISVLCTWTSRFSSSQLFFRTGSSTCWSTRPVCPGVSSAGACQRSRDLFSWAPRSVAHSEMSWSWMPVVPWSSVVLRLLTQCRNRSPHPQQARFGPRTWPEVQEDELFVVSWSAWLCSLGRLCLC